MKLTTLTIVSVMALGAALPAVAQTTTAKVGVQLNVRDQPSPFGAVLGALDKDQEVTIDGCLQDISWCKISSGSMNGWASGQYLYVEENANAVPLVDLSGAAETVTVIQATEEGTTKTDQNLAATATGTVGALTAFALGGPAGAIVAGAIAGTAVGAAAVEPTADTITYVTANPVETVYLDGEVVVGAVIPSEITTYEVPQPELRYLNINGLPVLVDANTGAIVQVVR